MSGQNYSVFGYASCYECGICPRRVPSMLLYNAYLPASRQLLVRDVGPCVSRSICSIVRLLYVVWGAGSQRCHVVLVAIAYTTRGRMIFFMRTYNVFAEEGDSLSDQVRNVGWMSVP